MSAFEVAVALCVSCRKILLLSVLQQDPRLRGKLGMALGVSIATRQHVSKDDADILNRTLLHHRNAIA